MKRFFCLLLASCILAAFSGCGRKVTFSTEDWENMEITVAGYRLFNDDPLNYEFAAGAEKFTEDYGTKVGFMVGGGDGMGEDLIAGIVAGNPWDVQYCFGISVFPLTFTENLYTPVTEYIDYKNNEMIDEITVEGTRWKGEYYGVSSLPMQEVWYLAYNETWMRELGIKTPHEYYAEGNWTMDAYKTINAEAFKYNIKSSSATGRPHISEMFQSEWNMDTGEVTVTYDSPENVEWLSYWAELLTDKRYAIEGSGKVMHREVIMKDGVMPNLMKGELESETKDVIRYIHYPNPDGELGVYLTDSHFLFPLGVPEEKMPCAFMLACYMTDMKSKMVTEELYKPNMTEEDFGLWEENLKHAYYLPRNFMSQKDVWSFRGAFKKDISAGKAVATHIAENIEMLKTRAEEFNDEYAD
ncbi:MAG: extracellular solute-binding protein [Clostridia bacterium]|nr:extracellular solute-binding protein [Clostridia bacterium]